MNKWKLKTRKVIINQLIKLNKMIQTFSKVRVRVILIRKEKINHQNHIQRKKVIITNKLLTR